MCDYYYEGKWHCDFDSYYDNWFELSFNSQEFFLIIGKFRLAYY